MFRHISLLCWKPDTSREDHDMVVEALRGLPATIPEIRSFVLAEDIGKTDGNYDLGIVADFDDEAAYVVYRDDATHQRIIRDLIRPILGARAAVQASIADASLHTE